jgi:hypothetical protein
MRFGRRLLDELDTDVTPSGPTGWMPGLFVPNDATFAFTANKPEPRLALPVSVSEYYRRPGWSAARRPPDVTTVHRSRRLPQPPFEGGCLAQRSDSGDSRRAVHCGDECGGLGRGLIGTIATELLNSVELRGIDPPTYSMRTSHGSGFMDVSAARVSR